MSCSIFSSSCNDSSKRIASASPQAIASRTLIWPRINSVGNSRYQPSRVSRSPLFTRAMAQLSIQLMAWSVSPAAIACWTASVHNSWEAYQRQARNFVAEFSFQPLPEMSAEKRVVAVPLPCLIERHQQKLANLNPFEQIPARRHAGHRLAQGGAKAVQDGGSCRFRREGARDQDRVA